MRGGEIMGTEGLFFYFLSWVSWIVVVFFFPKSKHRTQISIALLLIIAGSNSYFYILQFKVNLAFIFLAAAALILLTASLRKNYFLHYFSICTISLAYVCFRLFEIYDPVWILFNRIWMLSFVLLYLALLLFKTKQERFVFLLTGAVQGEIINGWILNSVFSYPVVGGFDFLSVLALSLAGLSVWIMFETITIYLDSFIQKRVKEKQG
jgi:hypothetical protein